MSDHQDILDKYINSNSGNECPAQYHRWAFISAMAACIGRDVSVKFGHKQLYPTMYVVLVGLPASRKSTAIDIVETLLKASGYQTFAFTKTSREKFLMDLNEGFNARKEDGELDMAKLIDTNITKTEECREAYICADELVDFLGMHNFNFLNTLTTLWDNKNNYPERLKNSVSINIPKPTVNLLGGFTPQNLSLAIPPEMIGQGATSRFIFVHAAKPSKRITFPQDMDNKVKNETIEFFDKMMHMKGECKITPEAEELLDEIYQNFEELHDSRLHHYCSRRLIHLLKLCVIFSCMYGNLIITDTIVEKANTILSYTESSMTYALGEFGQSKTAKATQSVMEVFQSADKPLGLFDLWGRISNDVDKPHILGEILENLLNSGKIMQSKNPNDSGDTTYILNRDLFSTNKIGVNYERWIQEYRGVDK